MAKVGPKEINARALREAQQGSRGGGESRPATNNVSAIVALEPAVLGTERVEPNRAGVASGPREAKSKSKGSGAARTATVRKKKLVSQPPGPPGSAATSKTTTHQYRDPEKRKAYIAKYMRDRRAMLAKLRGKA